MSADKPVTYGGSGGGGKEKRGKRRGGGGGNKRGADTLFKIKPVDLVVPNWSPSPRI